MSTTTFVDQVNNLIISTASLQRFSSRNSFPEFYSSAFPIFSLSPSVSVNDLNLAIDQINAQACAEISFSRAELEEMGLAARLPTPWDLNCKEPEEVMRWYLESFDKSPNLENDNEDRKRDPEFYPLGFIGIDSPYWQEKGIGAVLVYYDVIGHRTDDERITIKAFRVDPETIGAAVISLRQGDDDIDNVRRHCDTNS